MITNSVFMSLSGKFKLERLTSLGFRAESSFYYFTGVAHIYTFTPIDSSCIHISIRPKPSREHTCVHRVTSEQIKDWVGKCVDTIEVKDRRS